MDDSGVLSNPQINILSIVYLTLLTPSVIGSFSVLVVSIVKWKRLKEQVHLLVQLALADLLAALILMLATILNKINTDNNIAICQYSLPLSLTFYLISFLLVVVYAWKSKNSIQGWRASEDEGGQSVFRRQIVSLPVYAMVWLIPIAAYFAYVLTHFIKMISLQSSVTDGSLNGITHNSSEYCTSCILFLHVWYDSCPDADKVHDICLRVLLPLIVITVLFSCSVIYYKVGKWYERHEQCALFPVEGDGRSRRSFKTMALRARSMVLVILICWVPALLLILLSPLIGPKNVERNSWQQSGLFALFVIQAASVSLHGFLNSIVYAWKRPNFTEAVLGENTPLVAQNRMPFFEESLRISS